MTIREDSIQKKIKSMVEEILDKKVISNTQDLTMIGLDSITSIQLIVEIEVEFSVSFDDYELLLDNFKSIELIEKMIESKRHV